MPPAPATPRMSNRSAKTCPRARVTGGVYRRSPGLIEAQRPVAGPVARGLHRPAPMSKTPISYQSTHPVQFSELDPYNHMSTGQYAKLYVDHRMCALRDTVGWDLKTLGTLPFMTWVRRMEI